jgi:DNA-directed RNA polymerase specialized sigma24 family protein
MTIDPAIPNAESKGSARRHITPEAFHALMAALGDAGSRADRYEQLRSRLIFFFSRRLLSFPEDLADEVLDRLAFRLSQHTEIASVEAFALGIARHVAQESKRKDLSKDVEDSFFYNIPAVSATQSDEPEIVRMERCLKKLPSAEARLIKEYYLATDNNMIQARKSMAGKMGISQLTLRQRVFVVRQRLKECMVAAKGKSEG